MLSLAAVVGHHGLWEWCPRELGPVAWGACLVSPPVLYVLSAEAVMAGQGAGGVWVVLGETGSTTVLPPAVDPALAGRNFFLGQRTQLSQSRGIVSGFQAPQLISEH